MDLIINMLFTILVGIILGLIWRLYDRITQLEKVVIRMNEDIKWLVKYLNGSSKYNSGDRDDSTTDNS